MSDRSMVPATRVPFTSPDNETAGAGQVGLKGDRRSDRARARHSKLPRLRSETSSNPHESRPRRLEDHRSLEVLNQGPTRPLGSSRAL